MIGGGPCTYNPEPLAEFFDLFYIGEGETVYDQLLDAYKEVRKRGGSRQDYLERAAEIEGIYVPSFYEASTMKTEHWLVYTGESSCRGEDPQADGAGL